MPDRALAMGPPAWEAPRTTNPSHRHVGRKGKPSNDLASRAIATPHWKLARYVYSTNGTSIADALRSLSAAAGVPIDCAPGLAGLVEGRFDLPPQRFVEMLAQSYGLVWYYDGVVMHVGAAGDVRTLTMRLNYTNANALRRLLSGTGRLDPRFPLRTDAPAPGLVSVTAPGAYLALIERIARRLEHDARARVETAVAVINLHHGTAADRIDLVNGRASNVPGVAHLAARALHADVDPRTDIVQFEPPLPVLTANPDTNAVLIRDRRARIDEDKQIVQSIDRAAKRLALRTLVADVDASALDALDIGPGAGASPLRLSGSGDALRAALTRLAARRLARIRVDSELQTLDRVTAACEDGTGTSQAGAFALRIVPQIDSQAPSQRVKLAVELRGAQAIDTARLDLAPDDAMVMVEPISSAAAASAPASAAGGARMRLVMIAPRVIDMQ